LFLANGREKLVCKLVLRGQEPSLPCGFQRVHQSVSYSYPRETGRRGHGRTPARPLPQRVRLIINKLGLYGGYSPSIVSSTGSPRSVRRSAVTNLTRRLNGQGGNWDIG
jgi:hypothetical protein